MQTAAAYIRVSTEDQIEYSPDSQLKKIQEYAENHGILLPPPYIYLDEGISGRSAHRRPAFMRMIGMAKQKPRPFDLILVWKFSRFARNRQDSILYKSMLRKDCGINVISITEQLSDDPTSILIEALLEAMDEYYSINLAQEVRRGMNEKFSRGGVVSVPPFGYRMGSEHFEPDPEKAPFVPLIFQDFVGGMSCRQIAVRLNELGIRTSRDNPFESRSVEYILTNPTYLGKLRRTADDVSSVSIVDGRHPALIEPEIFRMTQDRITKIKTLHPSHIKTSPPRSMLHGLVRCSNCGSTLTTTEKGRSLQCHRYAKGSCSQSHHVRLDFIKHAFLSGLQADLKRSALSAANPAKAETDPPELRISIHQSGICRSGTAALSRLLTQEEKRLERIKSAYESGIDTLEEYRTNKRNSEERIQKLQAEIIQNVKEKAQLPNHISFFPEEIPSLLQQKGMSESAKNELLKSFISHITFYRSRNAIQIHYCI